MGRGAYAYADTSASADADVKWLMKNEEWIMSGAGLRLKD
jgi:hypothetical protein